VKKEVGLWIDHRQAILVISLDQEGMIKRISSHTEKRVLYSGSSRGTNGSQNDSSEEGRDRRFDDQLNRYYDEVIACLHDATAIVIMGPNDVKGELQKRLVSHGLSDRIVTLKTAGKITADEIAAEA
jgi:hypothetical protein